MRCWRPGPRQKSAQPLGPMSAWAPRLDRLPGMQDRPPAWRDSVSPVGRRNKQVWTRTLALDTTATCSCTGTAGRTCSAPIPASPARPHPEPAGRRHRFHRRRPRRRPPATPRPARRPRGQRAATGAERQVAAPAAARRRHRRGGQRGLTDLDAVAALPGRRRARVEQCPAARRAHPSALPRRPRPRAGARAAGQDPSAADLLVAAGVDLGRCRILLFWQVERIDAGPRRQRCGTGLIRAVRCPGLTEGRSSLAWGRDEPGAARSTSLGTRGRRVLRRRQHDDGRRVDLPLRQGTGGPRVLQSWHDLPVRGASRPGCGCAARRTATCTRTRESALAFVAGKTVDEIVALGEEIYDEEMADRIWSGTLALAQHAPRRRPAGLAGDRDAGRARDDHRPAARADRRAGHRRRVGRRRLHRPAGRRRAARRRRRRAAVRALAEREGLDLDKLQRPTPTRSTTCRCCRWSATRWRSTRTPRCGPRPASAAGRSATSAPVARRPGSASRARASARRGAGRRRRGRRDAPMRGRGASRPAGAARRPGECARFGGAAVSARPSGAARAAGTACSWMVSRTRSVRSKTASGRPRRSRAELGRSWIGSPNSMYHLLGSGTSPSGPSHGNVGVIGK